MSPTNITYHSSFSPFPIDLNQDQHPQLFSSDDGSSSSSFSYPISINPPQQEAAGHFQSQLQPLQHQDEAKLYASHGGSWDHSALINENNNGLKLSVTWKKKDRNEDHQRENNSSVKWMSSKMRLMRNMMTSDQTVASTPDTYMHKFEYDLQKSPSPPSQVDNSCKNIFSNSGNSVRVCADCSTTKTPLWRSGPRGPKSLCNACGIRQRKARRAAMAAAQDTGASGTIYGPETASKKTNNVRNKEKKESNNSHLPFKKRCRFTAQARGRSKKLCNFEDLSIILSKNSTFHQQVFPQDEKEAAILLMALSYGLVHG